MSDGALPAGAIETRGPTATERLGVELAAGLGPGDVILLRGDLGAGKTTLVRGMARALGVSAVVTSPTFAIGNRYPVPGDGRGLAAVAHLDLYRLAALTDEDPDLLADYVGPELTTFVEWPGAGAAELTGLGRLRLELALEHVDPERRRVRITWHGRTP